MKKIIIVVSIIVVILSLNKNYNLKESNTIRFRVIANSNKIEDQKLKKDIINNVSTVINESQEFTSIEETRNFINKKLPEFDNLVKNALIKNNDKREYNIKYGLNYFPRKELNNEIYEEGMYESLVITLGEGQGDNRTTGSF